MFYTVGQNNSGGYFDHDASKGIGYRICVEADSAEDANKRIESILDSYDQGGDCSCCGPRWSAWFDDDDGCKSPSNYSWSKDENPLTGGWNIPAYIHYANGTIASVLND